MSSPVMGERADAGGLQVTQVNFGSVSDEEFPTNRTSAAPASRARAELHSICCQFESHCLPSVAYHNWETLMPMAKAKPKKTLLAPNDHTLIMIDHQSQMALPRRRLMRFSFGTTWRWSPRL
jgi:hypothetical protein